MVFFAKDTPWRERCKYSHSSNMSPTWSLVKPPIPPLNHCHAVCPDQCGIRRFLARRRRQSRESAEWTMMQRQQHICSMSISHPVRHGGRSVRVQLTTSSRS